MDNPTMARMLTKAMKWLAASVFAATIASPLASCAEMAPIAAQPVSQSSAPSTAVSDNVTYEYRLGSGDKIRLTVFGEPDLSGNFVVSGDGKVSLPLIGEIGAAGSTTSELQDSIATALKAGYLQNPRVNVEVMNFRPYYIMGEVNKPGQYDFSNGMTVERAVATASGYTYRADHKKVYIKHANQDREETVSAGSQVLVAPGDTIRVPERYF